MVDSFRTNRGRYVVADGRLRLESGFGDRWRRYYEGGEVIFVPMAVSTLSFVDRIAYDLVFGGGQWVQTWGSVLVVVLVLAYAIEYLRGFTRAKTIRLNRIDRIVPIRGSFLTQPRLIVHYRTHDGTARRRITLPSRQLSGTEEEFETAKRILDDRGLGVEGTGSAERIENTNARGANTQNTEEERRRDTRATTGIDRR